MSTDFKLMDAPLPPGATLLQASAGTGKTHTLAGIFLRLVVELGMEVDQILVVTFTDAATEELRERVRKVLARAHAGFQSGTSEDELTAALFQRVPDRAWAAARLRESLNAFDLAPIFTLHGFCRRLLRDRAFESGSLFDVELLADQAELVREVADDFWRRNFYEAAPLAVALARHGKLSPDGLCLLLKSSLNHHDLRLVSGAGDQTAGQLAKAMEASFVKAARQWRERRETIAAKFGSQTRWAKGPYKNDAAMSGKFAMLEAVFAPGGEILVAALADFTPAVFQEHQSTAKSAEAPPTDPFFDACAELFEAAELWLTALRRDFLTGAGAELAQRKRRLKAQSYDDLLTRARDALRGPGGDELVRELRGQFKAALIDEFQDTDSVQWEIFKRLFAAKPPADPLRLFLVGDPKQAIYSFRGADIFTYLEAADTIRPEARFTLGVNWRSESPLVQAVNLLFAKSPSAPFVFDGIPFQPVRPSPKADAEPLTVGGRRGAALNIWFVPRKEQPVAKVFAEAALVRAVAGEIVRLLRPETEARMGGRLLRFEDIAVLAMTNAQADLVQEALTAAGVPCVLHTERGVFQSREAADLLRILNAIGAQTNESWLRAALATPLLGEDAAQLASYARDEAAWRRRRERFEGWLGAWEERGFAVMFRRLLMEEGGRARLLLQPGGERSLTNLLHLGELLQRAEAEERLGVAGLLKWFGARFAADSVTAEEHQLRLERDDNAVRIVTVHKSKGLQYGIVFAPFCWRGSELRAGDVMFRDEETGGRVRDLGPKVAAAHLVSAERERLAENVRLLYVALTRAVHRCYFAWGAIKGAESSALAWLVHGHRVVVSEKFALDWSALGDEAMREDLTARVDAGAPSLTLKDLPLDENASHQPPVLSDAKLTVRHFSGTITDDWRIASFSSLTSVGSDEQPDYDFADRRVPDQPVTGIFAFPRGACAGTCLHKVFEELDFTNSAARDLRELVADQLQRHGFSDDEFGAGVATMVRRVLDVSLDGTRRDFTLSRLGEQECLRELEFCFPMEKFSFADWGEIFRKQGRPAAGLSTAGAGDSLMRLARLGFAPAGGFMKGFVDLVFRYGGKYYLLDWKSNWLGGRAEDYSLGAMVTEMERNFYTLQYHLYVLALNRWLAARIKGFDYERDFGGVFYIFLRGVEPSNPELGVFRDKPSAKLVAELSKLLMVKPVKVSR